MYNVMIVEDSKPILRNIKMLLNSLGLPIEVVATAGNGEEALELLQQQSVDLVLTDIRMPKMDGLTLIERIKPIRPDLLYVLISGYNDFEYTRKALNLQVFDYLLKPVEIKQLSEVMDRAMERLEQRTSGGTELLKDIVDPKYYASLRLGDQFHHYGKIVLLLRKQPFTPGGEGWTRDFIQQELNDTLAPHLCWVFPTRTSKEYLVLAHKSALETYSSVYSCLEAIRRSLGERGLQVAVGGQMQPADPGGLLEAYHRISGILDEGQRIHQPIVVDTEVSLPLIHSESAGLDRATGAIFVELIRNKRKEQFLLKLNEWLGKWRGEPIRLAELERFIGVLTGTFAQTGVEQDHQFRIALEASAASLLVADSYDGFCQEFQEWAKQSFDQVQSQNRKSAEDLFRQIEEYVRMNLYSYLSITDVALKFHVSPSYISRIMKKYTESTFVQYYTELKIKEACRLMASKPEMKFREVADILSFSDQHYFSKVFKEYTGYSPTDYKEKVLSGLPQEKLPGQEHEE
ncbi:response regulator [Paenibacillus senegalimassiliensis]|uniref:response regulator n=1 Tax=Paenibacillus senegalimassiliensis TaxID=1737426 RepID=UPI00073EBD93|nr:response regulator [Paenibacillus senegalimassiliensis]